MPGPVEAHEFHPERELMVQVFPAHIDVVILYTEAPGPRSDLFSLQFGLKGTPSGLLDTLAGRAILPRLLDGLQFEVLGEEPRTGEPEVRIRRHQGRLMAAAFVRYELPDLPDDQTRTVIVRGAPRSIEATPTLLYAGKGLQPVGPPSELTTLRQGTEIRATFRRALQE